MANNQKKSGTGTSLPAQAEKMEQTAPKSGYSLANSCDLVNKFRTEIFDKTEKNNGETAVLTNKDGTIRIEMPSYLADKRTDAVEVRDNRATSQVLDVLRILAYKQQSQLVILDVQEYMQLRGLSDAAKARKQLDDAFEVLWKGEITYTNTAAKRKEAKIIRTKILQSIQTKLWSGNRLVEFSSIFYALLTTASGAFVFQYPLALLATDKHKTPNAYYIGVRLAELYKKRNTITVATLLKACKHIPTVDEVREAGKRQYKQRIQSPFERDLNSISFIKWEYVDKAEKSYTPKTFTDFLNARIKFEFIGYPEEVNREDKGGSK